MCRPEMPQPDGATTVDPTKAALTPRVISQAEMLDAGSGSNKKRLFTRAEVEEKGSGPDAEYYFIIKKQVYKVPQKWAMTGHPGGEILLRDARGTDITLQFLGNHRDEFVAPLLKRFQVGYVEDEQSPMETEFATMIEDLQSDPDWFQCSYLFYAGVQLRYFAILFASVACVVYGESFSVRCILAAVLMGFYFQQVAFIGHDTGHNGVTHSLFADECLGLFWGNAMSGISGGWWKATHNVHHLVTNSVEYDPDIQHLPVYAVTEKYFKGVFSEYHMRVLPFDRISQIVVRFQHLLYYPILAVARVNLYLQSFLLCLSPYPVFRRWGGKSRTKELACLGFFWAWFSLLVAQLPTAGERIAFVMLAHAVSGILHVQITISHFPMPVIEGNPLKNKEINWIQVQLSGSMDVECPTWMDWFHGGLQFQAVHHLIPRIPRHNLRRLRDEKILPFCKKHGLEYKRAGFIACNLMVIDTLRKTADKVSPFLWDAINAQG
mmetsp:Transcript_8037/g.19365  ORF Transcript_8037/g.19365 Transcript_8037/m.19365 type:complete len:492 (+) Transcript_8037:227-1702(+)|eukprot:g3160.t1